MMKAFRHGNDTHTGEHKCLIGDHSECAIYSDLSNENQNRAVQSSESKATPEFSAALSRKRRPAETFHVIDFIREEMDARDWSIWTLVRHMSNDQSNQTLARTKLALEFLELREPDMLIGEELAAGLARAFGTGQELWLNLDKTWRDAQAAKSGASPALSVDTVESSVPHQSKSESINLHAWDCNCGRCPVVPESVSSSSTTEEKVLEAYCGQCGSKLSRVGISTIAPAPEGEQDKNLV